MSRFKSNPMLDLSDLSGKKDIEVGRYFGIKGSAVSETLKAVEQRMKEDEMFQRDINKLKGMIIEK